VRRASVLFCAAALALAGCGGAEGGGGGDQEEIRAVIESAGTRADPADCLRFQTQNMVEQLTKLQGEAAVRACEEAELEDFPLPTAVTVTKIEVDGDAATAQAAYEGGPFSEQVPVLKLVEEDGEWREDEVLEFAEFDRDAFVLEFGRGLLEKAESQAERRVFGCMVGELDKLDREGLEALIVDPSPQPIVDLTLACEPSSLAV
jgi:hypothetical protein